MNQSSVRSHALRNPRRAPRWQPTSAVHLRARRPGDARLRLVNRRPWGDTPPADEFVAEIHIHGE